MKRILYLFILVITLGSCCITPHTYSGHGRYKLKINCDKVIIDDKEYKLYMHNGTQLAMNGHTIARGIQRKYRPWTYVHNIDLINKKVDITFDTGLKSMYPLYTGNHSSIFLVYKKPWDIHESTCAQFNDKKWLVIHRFVPNGIYMDIQENHGTETQWDLIESDIFIQNNQETSIPEINTKVKLTNYNSLTKTGLIKFTKIN